LIGKQSRWKKFLSLQLPTKSRRWTIAGNPHTGELLLKLSVMEQGHADQLHAEIEELRIE
jgi:hypothetical protein